MPVAFLVASIAGALLTLNCWLPAGRAWSFARFAAAVCVSELPVHQILGQVALCVVFVALGALDAWPGQVALAVFPLSWLGLLGLLREGRRAGPVLERALGTQLERPRFPWRPFHFSKEGLVVERDLAYEADRVRRHRLDVYRPARRVEGAPVLVQIHGGGWTVGSKRHQGLPLMHHLAARGWICVSVGYRLAPRAPFPEQLVDVKRALAFVREHCAEWGGAPDRIVATGGSAGGHLAALLALTPGDPEYQPGFEDADTSVCACVALYGVYDFTEAGWLRLYLERLVLRRRYDDDREAFERASPLKRVRPDAPPFLVVHGGRDSLVPVHQARAFVHALGAVSRSTVAYAELPGAQHAFDLFQSVRCAYVVRSIERFLAACGARDPL